MVHSPPHHEGDMTYITFTFRGDTAIIGRFVGIGDIPHNRTAALHVSRRYRYNRQVRWDRRHSAQQNSSTRCAAIL